MSDFDSVFEIVLNKLNVDANDASEPLRIFRGRMKGMNYFISYFLRLYYSIICIVCFMLSQSHSTPRFFVTGLTLQLVRQSTNLSTSELENVKLIDYPVYFIMIFPPDCFPPRSA